MEKFNVIKKNLEDSLLNLTKRVEDIEDDLRSPPDDDWAEEASESQNDETQEVIERIAMEKINKIKVALSKLNDGTYGNCEDCGNKISLKRLEALPHAINCVDCTK